VHARQLRSAILITVGSELTTGETRDTNGGDLARELTADGVDVRRMEALQDDLPAVTDAIRRALSEADLVVTSGGLGPTPDDLTREAIAVACAETPAVDPDLEAWLEGLYARRGVAMPEVNRKQAWLIPSATALPNPAGTAPGWWVERPDGRVIVALPGPPRELRPVWHDGALPRLRARGLGDDRSAVTLRLAGIGESALVELIGDVRLRTPNPQVATYARHDAVDLRISAVASRGKTAAELVAGALAEVEPLVAPYLFARGAESWVDALGVRLAGRGLGVVEIGSAGQLGVLLGTAPWLVFAESLAADSAMATAHHDLIDYATRVRAVGDVEVGLALRARERAGDTAVTIAADIEGRHERVTRTAFLGGEQGRRRAALAAAAELWRWLAPDSGPAAAG
jgi:nicotinamide-nucleotide amidase